jgi:hypothetical protein
VVEGCYLMRDRFQMREVWENLGFDVEESLAYMTSGPRMRGFRSRLFTRIVPCVKDIGLWGPKVRDAYVDIGVLDLGDTDLVKVMSEDENIAEQLDAQRREMAHRQVEIRETIALATAADDEG